MSVKLTIEVTSIAEKLNLITTLIGHLESELNILQEKPRESTKDFPDFSDATDRLALNICLLKQLLNVVIVLRDHNKL